MCLNLIKAASRRVNKLFLMDILDILSSLDDNKTILCIRELKLQNNIRLPHRVSPGHSCDRDLVTVGAEFGMVV